MSLTSTFNPSACVQAESKSSTHYVSLSFALTPFVFFLTWVCTQMGDYHRYSCRVCTGDKRKDSAYKSLELIRLLRRCLTELPPNTIFALDSLINFAVFYYEILNSPRPARAILRPTSICMNALPNWKPTLSEEATRISQLINAACSGITHHAWTSDYAVTSVLSYCYHTW